MIFRIGHFCQCQMIYHAKIPNQPKNFFSTIKNTRFTASPVLEVLDTPTVVVMKDAEHWRDDSSEGRLAVAIATRKAALR